MEIGEYFIPSGDTGFTGVQLEFSPLIVQEGEPLGQMYGYKWLGLWSTDEATEAAKYNQKPGDNKYWDKNGNYEYDNDDREVIGNFMPKINWSYNTTINWKNFDFNLFVEGAHGPDMYNYNRMVAGNRSGYVWFYQLARSCRKYMESQQSEFHVVTEQYFCIGKGELI